MKHNEGRNADIRSPATSTVTPDVSEIGSDAKPMVPGVMVAERYRIGTILGRGGMSTVYRAVDTLLDRNVALKLLNRRSGDRQATRFRREAVVGQEGHPNLVTTYDAGIWDGRFFIAMELVAGSTLAEKLRSDGSLPTADLERLTEELLSGLAHLHEKGITHRDVKAGNVLITSNGTAKLADFGLARIPEDQTVTQAYCGVGTPAYMAPEQILGQKVGPPADLYALGVVLYEAATGERPFLAGTSAEIMQLQIRTPVDATHLDNLPGRSRNLILRLLAKKPSNRFADASACLQSWSRGRIRRPKSQRRRWIPGALLGIASLAILMAVMNDRAIRVEQVGTDLRGVTRCAGDHGDECGISEASPASAGRPGNAHSAPACKHLLPRQLRHLPEGSW